ncbi:MAG: Ppx/GppA family phosphatase [Cytophagales bacterium]|nr:Ppx/GppA family phosphatase [Armatimonadota bacterium]
MTAIEVGAGGTGGTTSVVAAVDIGTNSVKMTVAVGGAGERPRVLADRTATTRLGKKVDADGRLTDEAVARTLAALDGFAREARALGATRIDAVGTSALRDAANGMEFVARAAALLGGRVEVISGDREAALIYAAARHDRDLPRPPDDTTPLATMDIGGGSTEIVLGSGDLVTFRDSLQLGAVRLTERALPSDPPTTEERAAAAALADEILAAVPAPTYDGGGVIVVGSGGTAANLAAMELSVHRPADAPPLTLEDVHATRLTVEQIEAWIADLAAKPLAQRRETPGLEPDRADVIIAGAIIQARALRHLHASAVIVSLRGLRYGLLYEMLG